MYVYDIIKNLKFDQEIEEAVIKELEVNKDKIDALSEVAYEKENKKYRLCDEDPFTRLVVITNLVKGSSSHNLYFLFSFSYATSDKELNFTPNRTRKWRTNKAWI